MAGRQSDYGIEIPRSGQHPYMPGAVRFSTGLLIVAWLFAGAIVTSQFVTPTARNMWTALIVLSLGVGAIYGAGHKMAKDNPFHQEVLLRGVLRSLRGRTNLET
jgi:hypothetical protein